MLLKPPPAPSQQRSQLPALLVPVRRSPAAAPQYAPQGQHHPPAARHPNDPQASPSPLAIDPHRQSSERSHTSAPRDPPPALLPLDHPDRPPLQSFEFAPRPPALPPQRPHDVDQQPRQVTATQALVSPLPPHDPEGLGSPPPDHPIHHSAMARSLDQPTLRSLDANPQPPPRLPHGSPRLPHDLPKLLDTLCVLPPIPLQDLPPSFLPRTAQPTAPHEPPQKQTAAPR